MRSARTSRPAWLSGVKQVVAMVTAALVATACIGRIHTPYEGPAVSHRLVSTPAPDRVFDYARQPVPVDLRATPEHDTGRYRAWHLVAHPATGNGQPGNLINARYYRSTLPGTRGLVIVLPIWGSSTYPPEKITSALLRRSRGELNVLRVEGRDRLIDYERLEAAQDERALTEEIQRASERMRRAVIETRRLIDWAQQQPEIDSRRIGLVGFSISAIVAALVYQYDSRLAAVVPVMGSANIDQIVITCAGRLRNVQEVVLPRFGWTRDHYQRIVTEAFAPVDPARFSGTLDASRVLLIDALNDSCMPRAGQDILWHTLGRPERISTRYDHKISFLGMTPVGLNYLRRVIVAFLSARLAPGVPDINRRSFESVANDPARGEAT